MATRQIRARTGQLEDPLPEGKKLEEKEYVCDMHKITDPESVLTAKDMRCLLKRERSFLCLGLGSDQFLTQSSQAGSLCCCKTSTQSACRFPKITPVKHDGDVSPELSKEDVKAHKEELQHLQKKDPKHGGEPNNMSKFADNTKSMATGMSGR